MIKRTIQFLFISVIVCYSWGCSSSPEKNKAIISGEFSVADSVQKSNDYSKIGFTIIKKDSANADADTLFHALTDSSGAFSGTVSFPERRQYQAIISRYNRNIGRTGIILADGDTISVEGILPTLNESFSISSREREAMNSYQRLNKNFQRVREYANAGLIEGDSLRRELNKWSNLYWQVYNDRRGTLGSILAGQESIRILEDFDHKKMMRRLRSVDDQDIFSYFAAKMGSNSIANNRGIDSALAYLDTLIKNTSDIDRRMQISMERIKLLYDSARVEDARKALTDFKNTFSKDQYSQDWVESINYDLNYLAPGQRIPSFKFTQNGRKISSDSLIGKPYILEITRLSNKLYQQQFDRTVAIHSIYKNYGFQVVTIPLDQSQITVNAFFDERMKPWPVADAAAFDKDSLVDKFNIQLIPTRFLVDRDGMIIRKYVGREYQDVIQDIQTVTNNNNEGSPTS
ncbi:Thioredoxin-like [Fodinibius salinus]|uniref:Thioredoxin-like n=1 Tax=Fodinibius salinus TaxID=860790 RepID=A0A5D3YMC2_9BACT|nr:thioredoxin-like domain-containing protein [Fodinibius salinus]TYP95296.1 Thioredoxin-like [Fodinibius salinus]